MNLYYLLFIQCLSLLLPSQLQGQSYFFPTEKRLSVFHCKPDSIYVLRQNKIEKVFFQPILKMKPQYNKLDTQTITKLIFTDKSGLTRKQHYYLFDDANKILINRKAKRLGAFTFLDFNSTPNSQWLVFYAQYYAFQTLLPHGEIRFEKKVKNAFTQKEGWLFSTRIWDASPNWGCCGGRGYELYPFEFEVNPTEGFQYFIYRNQLNPYVYCKCQEY
ncbi:MAG: hypothetical protein ACKVTZ_03305 [Bacteroidia bacterium]